MLRRRLFTIFAVIFLSSVLVNGGHALQRWYAGYVLTDGSGSIIYPTGVGGEIDIQSQPAYDISYWVGLSGTANTCCQHVFMGAGYTLGNQPDGSFDGTPEIYVDWQDANGIYVFHSIMPASWGSQHAFKVWIFQMPCCPLGRYYGAFAIDGVSLSYNPYMDTCCGQAQAQLEADNTNYANSYGHWSQLIWLDATSWID